MPNYLFSASLSPTTSDDALYMLKQTLKAAGWTVPSSSNGTTFAAGDILSTSGDFGSHAWYILKQPLGATGSYGGVRREIAIQKSTTGRSIRAKYSYSSSFTGSATATVMPTSSLDDGVRIIGSELPAFGFDASTLPTDGTAKMHICADQEPPYSFYWVFVPNGGGAPVNALMFDGMVSGTFDTADTDPYVFYWSDSGPFSAAVNGSSIASTITASTVVTPICWTRKGMTGQIFGGIGILQYSQHDGLSNNFSANLGTTNAFNSKDDLLPVIWYRGAGANPSGQGGYKGVSSLMKIPASVGRATGDTYSTTASGSKDYILFNRIALVWNGTDPVI